MTDDLVFVNQFRRQFVKEVVASVDNLLVDFFDSGFVPVGTSFETSR
jgi:hypothetical protein